MEIIVLVTAKDQEEAKRIGEKLVAERLAACVNILPGIHSIFWWQGEVDRAEEVLLILKSKKDLFEDIVATVKVLHSYDVPEVIALPILDGNKDYLKWIRDSLESV